MSGIERQTSGDRGPLNSSRISKRVRPSPSGVSLYPAPAPPSTRATPESQSRHDEVSASTSQTRSGAASMVVLVLEALHP